MWEATISQGLVVASKGGSQTGTGHLLASCPWPRQAARPQPALGVF